LRTRPDFPVAGQKGTVKKYGGFQELFFVDGEEFKVDWKSVTNGLLEDSIAS
jgi:hypothetical protein